MSNIFADEATMNNEWYVHVMELTPLPKNWILIISLYFFTTTTKADFYPIVLLMSVAYGFVVWGSCEKCRFLMSWAEINVRFTKWKGPVKRREWYRDLKIMIPLKKWNGGEFQWLGSEK